jgi:methionyl-tRNA formyltransferase
MRILFFGLPLAAHLLARDGHNLVGCVLGLTELPGVKRVRALARDRRHMLVLAKPELEDESTLRALEATRPDVILSWFYPRKVPPRILSLPKLGAFGTHPSLLPRWRGPDPYHWAIRSGDAETGVTLHRLDGEYDTGNIVSSDRLTIGSDENAWTLARKLDRPALRLLRDAATRLAAGEGLEGTPQSDALASYAPLLGDDDLDVDWHRTTDEVLRFVRACAPSPGAIAEIGDHVVSLQRARRSPVKVPLVLEPGEAFICPEGLVVRTLDGGVLLGEILDENDEIRRGNEIVKLLDD